MCRASGSASPRMHCVSTMRSAFCRKYLASGFNYDRMCIFDFKRELIVEHKFLLGDERCRQCARCRGCACTKFCWRPPSAPAWTVRTGLTVGQIHDEKDRVTVAFSDGRTRLLRPARRLRRDTFDDPAASGRNGLRAAAVRLRRLARASAAARLRAGHGVPARASAARPAPCRSATISCTSSTSARRRRTPFSGAQDYPDLFKHRLSQYGGYVADVAASLDANSDIVYSPIEPMLLPWPWFRGRVVLGGDAAHTFPPHLTQGAAMAAEDGYVLAREVLADDAPVEARLLRYSKMRYARCAFVYTFSYQWMAGRAIGPHVGGPCGGAIGAGEERVGTDRRERPHPRQPYYLARPAAHRSVRCASAPELKRHQRREHDRAAERLNGVMISPSSSALSNVASSGSIFMISAVRNGANAHRRTCTASRPRPC